MRLRPLLLSEEDRGGHNALQTANGVVASPTQMVQASNATFAAESHDVQIHGWGFVALASGGELNAHPRITSNDLHCLTAA